MSQDDSCITIGICLDIKVQVC